MYLQLCIIYYFGLIWKISDKIAVMWINYKYLGDYHSISPNKMTPFRRKTTIIWKMFRRFYGVSNRGWVPPSFPFKRKAMQVQGGNCSDLVEEISENNSTLIKRRLTGWLITIYLNDKKTLSLNLHNIPLPKF